MSNDQEQQTESQIDRRISTRIYNRLKSLKMISRQFSKRSIDNNETAKEVYDNKHYKRLTNNNRDRTNHTKPSTIDSNSSPARLIQADDRNPSEEAISSMYNRLALLFPPVRHLWPNKDTIEGLAQYMNDTTCRKYFGELRSMMVELTPTVFGAISDKYDGNRRLADLVNRPVTDWIRQRWLHCINIVASDYFLGNDLIRLSIHANKLRLDNSYRQRNVNDLSSSSGQCRNFRRIEHLLDKSRIASSNQDHEQQLTPANYNNNHMDQPTNPEGISDLFSFFKRIFNL